MGMIPGKSLHHVWSRHINRKTSLLKSIKVDNICFLSIWLHSTPIYLLGQSLFSPEILISFVSHLDPFPSFQVGNGLHRFSFTKLFQFLFSTAFVSALPATVFRQALKHTQQLHSCASPHHCLSLCVPPFSSLFCAVFNCVTESYICKTIYLWTYFYITAGNPRLSVWVPSKGKVLSDFELESFAFGSSYHSPCSVYTVLQASGQLSDDSLVLW